MSQNTVTIKLDEKEADNLSEIFKALDWVHKDINNDFVKCAFTSPAGSTAILYSSGKLVLQGNEDFTESISHIKQRNEESDFIQPHIGVDEVGKGDYFGPLVVVACYVNNKFADKLSILGFDDSKKFTDSKIKSLYSHVKDYPYYYPSVVKPSEYNNLVNKDGNVSIVLAKQHSRCIEQALKDLDSKNIPCSSVVIDQFSASKNRVLNELGELGKNVNVEQFHKGESDIAVAAASIIARGIFLEEFELMKGKYEFDFPKGASEVIESGSLFVKKYGRGELRNVAKVGFKTTQKILALV